MVAATIIKATEQMTPEGHPATPAFSTMQQSCSIDFSKPNGNHRILSYSEQSFLKYEPLQDE